MYGKKKYNHKLVAMHLNRVAIVFSQMQANRLLGSRPSSVISFANKCISITYAEHSPRRFPAKLSHQYDLIRLNNISVCTGMF